jgi:hypothetical protein
MTSIFLAKNTFIEWAKTQKKEQRKPFIELPAELLNCFERFQIGKKCENRNEEYDYDSDDDNVIITLHQYPFWAVQDWFYIYQQWSCIALNYTTHYSVDFWKNMPSFQQKLERKVDSVSHTAFREICDGMSGFLHYLFQNDRLLQQKDDIHFEPSGLVQSYINYICIAIPII